MIMYHAIQRRYPSNLGGVKFSNT